MAEVAHLCTFPHISARFCALRVVLPQRNRIAVELDTPMPFPLPYFSGKCLSSFRIHSKWLLYNVLWTEELRGRLSASFHGGEP